MASTTNGPKHQLEKIEKLINHFEYFIVVN